MKATTKTPNTLFLALWNQEGRCITIGNLRTKTEMMPIVDDWGPVVENKGNDPVALLAATLKDAKALCARHVVVFTNDEALADLYTFPVHLEPKGPDRMHLYVPAQWDVLRAFCLYDSWQCQHVAKLPKAKQAWEMIYGHSN